jgi:predicted RNase H-like HicB family nuclease
MRTVRVIYHDDPDGWWAESPEVPGYTGFGESYADVRDQMREGLPWFAEEDLLLTHIVPSAEGQPPTTAGPHVSFDITRQPDHERHLRHAWT